MAATRSADGEMDVPMPDAEAVAAAEAADATAARRHGLGPTPTARFRAMLANPDKLNAIVDGMASALASVLSLKDADCDLDPRSLAAKPTLCELFYEKGSYWSTPAKQREQEKCIEMFYFASDCESLAARMRAAARQRDNLLLAEFSRAEPYCYFQECFRYVGQTRSRVLLGRIGGALRDTVHELAHDWLCACDHAMCQAFQDFGDRESAAAPRFVDADRLQVFDDICGTIAERVAMVGSPTLDGRELSVRLLEELGAELLAQTAPAAEATKTRDLAALDGFLCLARRGLKDSKGALLDWARDLPALVRHLRYVLERPPVELCLHGANAAKINLALLSRAASPDELDYFVRVDLLQLWHEQHGVFAAVAAQHAIEQIRRWTAARQSAFIGVLHTADVVRDPLEDSPTTPPHANAVRMPDMPFVNQRRPWWFARHGAPQRRTGLDWTGRRIVRATSLIWQLLAYGELELGVVAAGVTMPILTQALVETRIAKGLIREQHAIEAFANDLLELAASISDRESHHDRAVAHALCALGGFSAEEIHQTFDHRSRLLPFVLAELETRTEARMLQPVPAGYTGFARDGLSIVLPIALGHRAKLGLAAADPGNPLTDLLRTIPRLRAWTPLMGTLQLTVKDLKLAAPMARAALDELSRREVLVRWRRPWLDRSANVRASTYCFVFDTMQLLHVLGHLPVATLPKSSNFEKTQR